MKKNSEYHCLIVDDDPQHNLLLTSLAEQAGLKAVVGKNISDFEEVLDNSINLAFAFISLDIVENQRLSLFQHPALQDTDIALIHSQDDPFAATRAIREGATYFFCKSVNEQFVGDLLTDLAEELAILKSIPEDSLEVCSLDQFGLLHGSSKPMHKLYRALRKVAATDASVLLIGESGTGKELAAQTIHELSDRSEKPFVAMNCGAIPPELVESELFGHEKGSFSGADRKHIGYFEQAQGGTLLLDELAEMPLEIQVKFLRVLESKKFRRVGGEQEIDSDVRIIAATNRDPELAIKQSCLRKDLYFRIAQFPLRIPSLRDRGEDIFGLAQYFLNELNEINGTEKQFAGDLSDLMCSYPWPGNVRELKGAIERAYIMAGEIIQSEHFPSENMDFEVEEDYLRVSVGSSLEDAEKKLIFATLEACEGNKKQAAEQLGISVKTLYNKLKSYEL